VNLLDAFARCHGKYFAICEMCKHCIHGISFFVLSSTKHNVCISRNNNIYVKQCHKTFLHIFSMYFVKL
jgi:hypothetical protein